MLCSAFYLGIILKEEEISFFFLQNNQPKIIGYGKKLHQKPEKFRKNALMLLITKYFVAGFCNIAALIRGILYFYNIYPVAEPNSESEAR